MCNGYKAMTFSLCKICDYIMFLFYCYKLSTTDIKNYQKNLSILGENELCVK